MIMSTIKEVTGVVEQNTQVDTVHIDAILVVLAQIQSTIIQVGLLMNKKILHV